MKILNFFFLLPVVQAVLRCISLYGCETDLRDFVCSWTHPVEYYIDKLHELDFNCLRLPFSRQWVLEGDFSKMDRAIKKANEHNMSIILDLHRINNDHQDVSPFTHGMTMDEFKDIWFRVIDRYKWYGDLSINAYNEYQLTDTAFLVGYTADLFTAMEARYGDIVKRYYVTGTNWSGNLAGVSLEFLPFHDKIYYSVHKYWFSFGGDFNYEHDWDISFGNNTKKLIIGEFGWKSEVERDVQWVKRLFSYLKNHDIKDTCLWTIAHSGDTNGLWYDDCENIDWVKYNILRDFWFGGKRRLRHTSTYPQHDETCTDG